jgi:hypothetical protein
VYICTIKRKWGGEAAYRWKTYVKSQILFKTLISNALNLCSSLRASPTSIPGNIRRNQEGKRKMIMCIA